MPDTAKFDTLIPGRRRQREALLRRFPGLLYDVARLLGVSRPTVSNVFHRQGGSSRRVREAIARELLSRMAGHPRPQFEPASAKSADVPSALAPGTRRLAPAPRRAA